MVQDAFQFYKVARTCFERPGSIRGVAVVILREVCLRQALTMPAGYIWTREEVEQISNLFSWLEFLFAACGDIWNQRRVQTHRTLIYARIFDRLALAWRSVDGVERLATTNICCALGSWHPGLLVTYAIFVGRFMRLGIM